MKKKRLFAALILCAGIVLSGCGSNSNRDDDDDDWEDYDEKPKTHSERDEIKYEGKNLFDLFSSPANPESDFEYSIKNGEVCITSYIGSSPSVIIPEKIADHPVRYIGEECFIQKNVTYVDIPYGITEIRNDAFSHCESLTNIKIPDSVIEIGDEAFSYCSSLTDIEIPESVEKLGQSAFLYCNKLTHLRVSDSIIYNSRDDFMYSFYGCKAEVVTYSGVRVCGPDTYKVQTEAPVVTTAPYTTTDVSIEEPEDTGIKVTRKLKWLSWYPIDENSPEVELFKANYGVPEAGDASYGDYADCVFHFTNVSYHERYDKLGQMVSSGDSPDIFPFEIGYFPLSAYKGMFQSIDGIVDTYSEEWADTREDMDKFMWGGKNYCAITEVAPSNLFWYRRSIVSEAGLADPYELYKKGKWTWDTFLDMAEEFQNTGSSKYICDGWDVARPLLCTTGVPLISLENGKACSNLYDSNIERTMEFISKLAHQDYRYPIEQNDNSVNTMAWANGDILFFVGGTWFYEETAQKYMRKLELDEDDIFFVPAPKAPSADAYYHEMRVNPYMFVAGSYNVEGFKAWTNCVLAASKDPDVKAAQREKSKRDYYWTDEQLDFLDELTVGGALTPVFDFSYGISYSYADTDSGDSPVQILVTQPYISSNYSYEQLRTQYEEEINIVINEINHTY